MPPVTWQRICRPATGTNGVVRHGRTLAVPVAGQQSFARRFLRLESELQHAFALPRQPPRSILPVHVRATAQRPRIPAEILLRRSRAFSFATALRFDRGGAAEARDRAWVRQR